MPADLRSRLEAALPERYRLDRELGRGGMAVVFLAQDRKLERSVALKVLRPELSATIGPERFLQEIKLAAGLTHPHIAGLHDSGDAGGLLYYVMPFVEGESLRARLSSRGRLPVAEAVRIACQVADALDYAHHRDVVHRDVKPENILLQGGHAVVTDFGIARAISAAGGPRMTAFGIAVGTPEYMSPEQAAADARVDGRSDVYSLGCVLYEMLTGGPPFTGGTASDVMAARHTTPVPTIARRRPDVPLEVELAVQTSLARRPGERFQTAAEFAAALTRLSGPLVLQARRRRLLRTAAAVVGLTLVGTVLWVAAGDGAGEGSATAWTLDPTHIAVLYFDDLSARGDLGHVASGLTQDLIDELSAVPVLRVVPSSGVKPYRTTSVPLDSIARALQVGTLVEGSVARAAGRVRVTVRLIDAVGGTQLHSQTLERPLGDLFALQDGLTAEVSRMLRQRLGREVRLREERAGTRNVEAWQLKHRADSLGDVAAGLLTKFDYRGARPLIDEADSLYAAAAARDRRWIAPVVARGWMSHARARVVRQEAFFPARGEAPRASAGPAFDRFIDEGLERAGRALALQPDAAEALELRGKLRFERWLRCPSEATDVLRAAEEDLLTAGSAKPGLARTWYTLSELYSRTGRFAEAEQAAHRALAADAYLSDARAVTSRLFFAALNRERFDEARTWCREGVRRFPDALNLIDCELRIMGWSASGRPAVREAWRLLSDIERRDTGSTVWADRRLLVAAIVARSGLKDSARAMIRRTRAAVTNPSVLTNLAPLQAYVHVLLGEHDAALERLAEALRANPQMRDYAAESPWFRSLRADPGFVALTRTDLSPPPP